LINIANSGVNKLQNLILIGEKNRKKKVEKIRKNKKNREKKKEKSRKNEGKR